MLLLVPKDILYHITEWLELWEIGMMHRICKHTNTLGGEMYRKVKQITIDRFSIVEHLREKCPNIKYVTIGDITISPDEMKVLHDFPLEILRYIPYGSGAHNYVLSFPRLRNLHIRKLTNFNLDACNMLTKLVVGYYDIALDMSKFPMLTSVEIIHSENPNFATDIPVTCMETNLPLVEEKCKHLTALVIDTTEHTDLRYLQLLKKIKLERLSIQLKEFNNIVNELPYITRLNISLSNYAPLNPITNVGIRELHLRNATIEFAHLRSLININTLSICRCTYPCGTEELISHLPVTKLMLISCYVSSEMLSRFKLKQLTLKKCELSKSLDLPESIKELSLFDINDLFRIRNFNNLKLDRLKLISCVVNRDELATLSTSCVKHLILRSCIIDSSSVMHIIAMKLDSLHVYSHDLNSDDEHMLRSNIRKVFINQEDQIPYM